MRLPYLQVTAETWDRARSLAALTGVDHGRAFLAICDLWRWGLDLGPDDQAPTGLCLSPRASRLLAAAIGWTGNQTELVDALCDLQLLEQVEGGLRVKGMGRYRRTWEKNRRRSGEVPETGKVVPETGAHGAGSAPKPAPQTQTQTQTQTQPQTQKTPPPPPAAAAEDPVGWPDIPEDPHRDGEAYFAHVQHRRRIAGAVCVERKPPKLRRWFSDAVAAVGDPPVLDVAYDAFTRDPYWASQGAPFTAFVDQWRKYAEQVRRAAA